jgi:hypothetical protein
MLNDAPTVAWGGGKNVALAVTPANKWALLMTRNSVPRFGPVHVVVHRNAFAVRTTLSSLIPMAGKSGRLPLVAAV